MKLTNRTGTVKIGNQDAVDTKRACFYTSYQTIIDWNGDVFLCPQDWQRRITMGNIMQKSFIDIWNGNILNKYRKLHLIGDRSQTPCNSCNANGMVYGEKHSKAWLELLNFKLNKVK